MELASGYAVYLFFNEFHALKQLERGVIAEWMLVQGFWTCEPLASLDYKCHDSTFSKFDLSFPLTFYVLTWPWLGRLSICKRGEAGAKLSGVRGRKWRISARVSRYGTADENQILIYASTSQVLGEEKEDTTCLCCNLKGAVPSGSGYRTHLREHFNAVAKGARGGRGHPNH